LTISFNMEWMMFYLWLRRIGTIFCIIGAALFASNIGFEIGALVAFLIGSLAWMLIGAFQRDGYLFLVQLVFVAFNIFGIYRWLS
jgi:hypothetical protein